MCIKGNIPSLLYAYFSYKKAERRKFMIGETLQRKRISFGFLKYQDNYRAYTLLLSDTEQQKILKRIIADLKEAI